MRMFTGYRAPDSSSESSGNTPYVDLSDMELGTTSTQNDGPENAPMWLQQLFQQQQRQIAQQQEQMTQMNQMIQQQGQQISQITNVAQQQQHPIQAMPTAGSVANSAGKRPRPKLPDPEKFSGEDLSLFPQFFSQLKAKLKIDAESIGNENDRVWYGFSRLSGKAAARVHPWVSTYCDDPTFSLGSFFKQLEIAFEDPARKKKALTRLNTLRQGNRLFTDLMSEFDQLLLEAGGHGWSDDVKKGYLSAALNYPLRERLVTVKEESTYENYCL